MMLSVSRKKNERVMIGPDVSVMVTSIGSNTVRLGIEAPRSVPIYREELGGREPRPAGRDITSAASNDNAPRLQLFDWPNWKVRFWWMQYRLKPRSKPKVMLVELVMQEGTEYIKPFQDNNCYPQSLCLEWQAKFKPCQSEPVFEGV